MIFVAAQDSMPGQKDIWLAKKDGGSSIPSSGFYALLEAVPFCPRFFAERNPGGFGKSFSRPFLSSPPALLPWQR
jgi:hypothetical protein